MVFRKGNKPWNTGKHLPQELRDRLSTIRKRLFADGKIRHWRKGVKGSFWNEESRKRKSESMKLWHSQNKYTPLYKKTIEALRLSNIGRKDSPERIEKQIVGLRRIRPYIIFPLQDTKIEVKLQEILNKLKIKFTPHKPIIGQPDIFIEPNLCIFADGCFWHNCDVCINKTRLSEEWQQKIEANSLTDKNITKNLIKNGYKVIRLWEHEIKSMTISEFAEKLKYNPSIFIDRVEVLKS